MDGRYEFHESDWKLFRKKIVDWQEDHMGHIKGAISIPNETISNTKPYLLPDTDKTILVYCQGGMRAGSAVRKLK